MCTVSRLALLLGLVVTPCFAAAQQAELISDDGLMTVEGTIEAFDGTMISIKTGYGVVKIPASEVACRGECPPGLALAPSNTEWSVSFKSDRQRILIKTLMSLDFVSANAGVDVVPTETGVQLSAGSPKATSVLTYVGPDDDAELRFKLGSHAATSFLPDSSLSAADGQNRQAFELAIEPYGIILGQNTGVESLTLSQIAGLFSGNYTNWNALGGNDLAVQLFATANAQSQLQALEASVLSPFGFSASNNILRFANDDVLSQFTSQSEGGIGMASLNAVDPDKIIPIRNACGGMVYPDAISVAKGTYPLTVSSYAVLDKDRGTDATTILLDSLSGDVIQNVVSASGYAYQKIEQVPADAHGKRLTKMLSADWPEGLKPAARGFLDYLLEAKQLSIRLDGTLGTDAALARTRGDFVRLAEAIESGAYAGHEVVFVGFSNLDSAASAIQEADRVAQKMLDEFIAFTPDANRTAGTTLRAQGHANVGVECFASEAGVEESFVEVWIQPTNVTQ
ncbi:MAG: hypothetical protein OXC60_15190 [Litoreibacter sp.]|nr:hypothetical protein [Litoreibacter sp.]